MNSEVFGSEGVAVKKVSVELEVPFHDVDAAQITWHGHYYKYLEIARTALFRSYDLDVADLVRMGYKMLVIESKCRYAFPLHYGDKFLVTAWFADIDRRIRVAYDIRNLTHDRRTARAHTTLVTMELGNVRLESTPDAVRRILAS